MKKIDQNPLFKYPFFTSLQIIDFSLQYLLDEFLPDHPGPSKSWGQSLLGRPTWSSPDYFIPQIQTGVVIDVPDARRIVVRSGIDLFIASPTFLFLLHLDNKENMVIANSGKFKSKPQKIAEAQAKATLENLVLNQNVYFENVRLTKPNSLLVADVYVDGDNGRILVNQITTRPAENNFYYNDDDDDDDDEDEKEDEKEEEKEERLREKEEIIEDIILNTAKQKLEVAFLEEEIIRQNNITEISKKQEKIKEKNEETNYLPNFEDEI